MFFGPVTIWIIFYIDPPYDEFDRIVATQLSDVNWRGDQIIRMEAGSEDVMWGNSKEMAWLSIAKIGRAILEFCNQGFSDVARAMGACALEIDPVKTGQEKFNRPRY